MSGTRLFFADAAAFLELSTYPGKQGSQPLTRHEKRAILRHRWRSCAKHMLTIPQTAVPETQSRMLPKVPVVKPCQRLSQSARALHPVGFSAARKAALFPAACGASPVKYRLVEAGDACPIVCCSVFRSEPVATA